MSDKKNYDLEKLGKDNSYNYDHPDLKILEKVDNPHTDVDYAIRFTCPEFTSICPVTGQPDFAHMVIDYLPGEHIVESKSLKLYMTSFRNHGAFHEDCTIKIAKDLIKLLDPKWLRIGGYWYPRGGIPIDIFFEKGEIPNGVNVPNQDVPSYKGRG
jgi:7-cyano-7-deazaguanine reductase